MMIALTVVAIKWRINLLRANGGKTASRTPVLNRELWEELDRLAAGHELRLVWVAGHGEHRLQNRADGLAGAGSRPRAGHHRGKEIETLCPLSASSVILGPQPEAYTLADDLRTPAARQLCLLGPIIVALNLPKNI